MPTNRFSQPSRGAFTGLLIMAVGGLLLLNQVAGASLTANLGPFLVLGLGLIFFAGMVFSGRGSGGLAIPGSILTTIGLIIAAQTVLDQPALWMYAWPLIIFAVGAGLFIMGLWNDDAAARRSGVIVAAVGASLFVVLTIVYQLGWGRFQQVAEILWPLALIGAGLLLILRRVLFTGRNPMDSPVTGAGAVETRMETSTEWPENEPAPLMSANPK